MEAPSAPPIAQPVPTRFTHRLSIAVVMHKEMTLLVQEAVLLLPQGNCSGKARYMHSVLQEQQASEDETVNDMGACLHAFPVRAVMR